MNILYIGDIMGRPGRRIVEKLLPRLKIEHDIDFVVAQAENISHGKGMSDKHYNELEEAGVNGFSGGNHTFERVDTMRLVIDQHTPVVAPANVKGDAYLNYKIVESNNYSIAIVSLQGYTFPKGYSDDVDNPLTVIDKLLPAIKNNNPNAVIVNIHGDLSSEKVMMGYYLDGKVAAVIGDHWHIPTADARVLPGGTAHITDVGMCGSLNSSLGVDKDIALRRWKGETVRNKMDDNSPLQFNAVLIRVDEKTGLATQITQMRHILD